MKRKFKKPLPNNPADLLEIAVDDAEKVSKMKKKYRLNMNVWHRKVTKNGLCNVCMAGAVMALRDGLKPSEDAVPADFPCRDMTKLLAIDRARVGSLWELYAATGREWPGARAIEAEAAIMEEWTHFRSRAPWTAYREAIAIMRGEEYKPKKPARKAVRKATRRKVARR